jgi:hypothetical protein
MSEEDGSEGLLTALADLGNDLAANGGAEPLEWRLEDLVLELTADAQRTGAPDDIGDARELAALLDRRRRTERRADDAGKRVLAAVSAYLAAHPDADPFTATKHEGELTLLRRLRALHAEGVETRRIALTIIRMVPKCRPGLPWTQRHALLDREARRADAAGLLRDLTRTLDTIDVETATPAGVTEWATRAIRAALRVYGDPQAANALKRA